MATAAGRLPGAMTMSDKKKARTDEAGEPEALSLSRRSLLKGVGLTGAALMTGASGTVAAQPVAAAAQRIRVVEAFETLTAAESATLDALASRILPSDDGTPGAHEARAVHYIDRALTGANAASRDQYAVGLQALDDYSMQRHDRLFHQLSPSEQDTIIEAMTENQLTAFPMLGAGFFNMVRNHTIDGTFSDPYYGGNRDFVGWDLIGYPGVRIISTPEEISQGRSLSPSRQSAYDVATYTKDPVDPAAVAQGGHHGH